MTNAEARILLIDDMPTIRKLVKMQLEKAGAKHISEAADGHQAWEKLSEPGAYFDVIISDWMMPNCTGIDLLRRVRSSEKYKDIPFIMVTAEAEKCSVVEAKQAGCTDYVTKPFDVPMLLARIIKLLDSKAA